MAGIHPPAFRLPDAARVGAVRYQIADLERSLWFYRDLVGLHLHYRGTMGNGLLVARLGVPGGGVLLELVEKKGARPMPRTGRLGLYHSALLLPSRAALGSFVGHLEAAHFPFGSSDHLVSEALYLRDPDGLTLEVYADRPRSAWVVRGNEYIATLDPLNLEDLKSAAGGDRWAGVPAGSVIGHVHFYVGDLDRAAAFYHRGLGMDKVLWSLPGALFMSAGGYHHHVGTNMWVSGAPVATDDDTRLLHWELIVPDVATVDNVAASLVQAGFRVLSGSSSGVTEGASAVDDWGIHVQVRTEENCASVLR
jgi:catechol 2,3-dioxygenase